VESLTSLLFCGAYSMIPVHQINVVVGFLPLQR